MSNVPTIKVGTKSVWRIPYTLTGATQEPLYS